MVAALTLEQQRALALARVRMRMQGGVEAPDEEDPIRARNDEQLRRIRERRGVAERTESEAEAFAKESPFLSSLADLAQSMFGGPTAAPVIQRREAVERQQGLQKVAEARQAEEARLGRGIARLTVREKAVEAARAIPRVAIESTAQSAGLLGAFGKEGEQIAKGFEGLGSRVVENLGLQEAEGVQFDPYASEAVKVGGAFGSVVPYLVTGGTRALAGAGSAIARGAGAAQVAMATGQGATEARQRIDEFEQETGQQVDPSTRQWVQLGGGAIGLSELLPIPGLIARLPTNVRQTATARLTDIATKAGLGRLAPEAAKRAIRETVDELESFAVGRVGMRALEEGTQEGGVNLAQNVLAKLAYNPEQEITEGVAESAALGAIVGGGIRAGTEGVQRLMPGREGVPEAPGTAPTAPPTPPVGAPPEIASATPISTLEIEDIEGSPTRIEILSAPDDRGNVWVRDQAGAINSVPQNILERMGATFEPQPEPAPIPTEPPVSPPVSAPPPEAPPATSPPGVSPIAEPVVPVEPETPTPPEAPTATPIEPVLPEPLPEPEPEPIAPPSAPQIRDEQTRDYWRSNLDRQREQVQAQVDTLSQQPDVEPAQIETLNQRLAEIEEDYRGLERGEAPIPRARPLDDTTASIVAEPNAALADAIRDLPAVGVMDWFAKNGTTDFHRELATRVGGLMKAMEQAGFEFNWGVYDQNYQPKDGAERDNYNYVMKKPRVRGAAWSHSKEGAARYGSAGKRVAPDYAFDRVDIGIKGPGLLNSGANEVTILHEFAHSVTTAATAQLRSKKISPNSRVGQAVKELRSLKRSAVTHKNKLLKEIASGKQVDPRLAQALQNLEGTNAWKDEDELIVQGLTNIDMQIVLKSMPYKKTNGFVEFIREIGRLIGVTEKDMNGLRRLFELTDELIPTDTAAQQEVIQAMMRPGEYGAAVTPSEVEAPTATAIGEEPVAPASTEAGEPDTPAGAVNAQGRPYVQISLGDEKRLDRYRRYWADRMRRLGFVEEAIEKATGHSIPRTQRPTEKASLFESRANERLEDLEKDHLKKITDFLRDEGISPNEADLFLLARTAQDRNAKIARRNPDMPDAGSGLSNAEAQAILLEFITDGRIDKMQRLAELVDAMTKQTRDTLVSYGMLTQEQADALVRDEPFYVPLKGLALDGDMSVTGDRVHREPGSGRGFSISRKEFKAAKGRSSLPFSPLANAMADAQAAIIRGERNRVGQSFLNDIVRKYDSNAWQVFTEDNPDIQTVYNSKAKQVEERPVPMDMFPDRYFVVKEDGQPYYIKISDPLLMRALTNASSKDFAKINQILGASIGAVTRTMSRLFTTFNPEFFVPNFARDIEAAVFNILAEQDAVDGRVAGKKIVKNVLNDIRSVKNARAIFNATFGREAATPEQQKMIDLFEQAKKDGAFTGWIMTETPQEQIDKIQRSLKKASGTGKERLWYSTVDGAASVLKAVEDFNSVFENITRFAVYKNALDAGLTRDEAAGMSRNVTVDFNKKGEVGPTANALYAFFNAAVRGNAQLIRSLTAKPREGKFTRAQMLAASMIGFGILQTLIGRAMSDEDEDEKLFYDKIPDWEKQRNLIVMYPNGQDYLKIPLPYGYSFFHTLGTLGAEVQAGVKSAGDMGVGIIGGLMSNFSPINLGGDSLPGIAVGTVPTALKPFADLMINENFFGSPIYNEPFDENQSLSSVARFSTPEAYKAIAEFLNEVSGGKGVIPGKLDIPAESLEYLVNTYIGGAGKFGVDAINLATKAAKGDDVEIRNVPVIRKVMGEPNQQADLGMYFDRINEIGPIERQLRDSRGDERRFLKDKHPVETDTRVIMAMQQAKRELRELNKQKRALLDRDMDYDRQQVILDRMNERQRDIYIRFNRTYNQVAKREGAPQR